MPSGAHVIVVGNEKGGSGKSTTAVHLAIYLLHQGFRVGSIDADSRQQTMTQYIRNRRAWSEARGVKLPLPVHYHLPQGRSDSIRINQRQQFDVFRQAVVEIERDCDYIVIDTPGFDTHLARLSHSLADTLVTPLNDSPIDLDVLAHLDPHTGEPRQLSHYARLVQRARAERHAIDGQPVDWVLVRNRIVLSSVSSMRQMQFALSELSARLDCRLADGIAERPIFRLLFPTGLTVFDTLADDLDPNAGESHARAREEYRRLVASLRLPLDERAAARRAALAAWSAAKTATPSLMEVEKLN